jgi:phosphate-selective porin OprO/OprP
MSSVRPTLLRVWAIVCGVLTFGAMASPLLAQAPSREVPVARLGFADSEYLPAPVPGPQQPARADIDRQAIQKMVREELQAEKARALKDAEKDKASKDAEKDKTKKDTEKDKTKKDTEKDTDSEWIKVGKDRTLRPRWDNGFVAETADESFRIHVGGRLEFDNSWFAQSNNLLIGPSPDQRMLDGTLFRRARLRADGRLWDLVDFACEFNFANIQDISNVDNSTVQVGSVGLTDCYVTFREVPCLGNVRVGHVQAPVGLERYSSSNAWYYMERSSLFDAFLNPNDYQNGVVVFNSYLDDRVTLAGSAAWIDKSTIQSFGFGANDGKYGFAARLTGLPVYANDGRTLVHLGADYYHQDLVNHQFSVASRELLRAGAGGSDTPNLVFTGTFFSPNGADLFDVEGAVVLGPFSLSSEYARVHVNDVFDEVVPVLAGPRGNVTYQAAYVEAGLFVTPGDYRRYDKKTGTWARTVPVENAFLLKPDHWIFGHGAVQLTVRYTYLDLVSGAPVLTPTSGGARAGRQQDLTLGVNWYLNSQTYVMLNGVFTHLDSVVPGASGNIQGIGCRVHIDF